MYVHMCVHVHVHVHVHARARKYLGADRDTYQRLVADGDGFTTRTGNDNKRGLATPQP